MLTCTAAGSATRLAAAHTDLSTAKACCLCVKVRARQKAISALEAQVAELTQQLHESDQSRLQLEKQLEAQHSSNTADAAAAQVGSFPPACMCVPLSLAA